MNRRIRFCVGTFLIACWFGLSGCGQPAHHGTNGRAVIKVRTQGLSASDVSKVTVTISGLNFNNIVQDLILENGVWQDFIGHIPAGSNRTFSVQAFNASNTLLYEGQLTNVTVTDQEQTLMFLLQQKASPTPFSNTVPEITGILLSTNEAAPSQNVTLSSFAQDADSGDTLTFAWTATGGTFDDNTSSAPVWSAPTSTGVYTLTLTVSDNRGGSVAASFTIQVQS